MKPDLDSQTHKMLRTAKLYRTRCRAAILKVLINAGKPLNQEQIAQRLGAKRFNKVSIYRTLTSLLDTGLVHRAFMDERAGHFELADKCTATQCHPHFTCTNCGSTHCLTEMAVPEVRTTYKGYIIHRQQVRLEGLCPACA